MDFKSLRNMADQQLLANLRSLPEPSRGDADDRDFG
jgi:hypothetical protein